MTKTVEKEKATDPVSPVVTFKIAEIATIKESKTNPRSHYDDGKLKELAESIKTIGIIQPLLVVEKGNGYEIVAGARRFRAAKLAGLSVVPVSIRTLTPEQILEAQLIENLQREDIHPLDEAKGYDALMHESHWTVQQVAEKVGRSEKYIYDRVKLLALTKDAQSLFWDGKFTAGHAILLARLSPADQKRVMGSKEYDFANGGLFLPEHGLFTPDEEGTPLEDAGVEAIKPVSVRELEAWIDQHVRFDPVKAEPMLFPETVQTVLAAKEIEEKIVPITHNFHVDPDAKDGDTRTYGPMSWKRADGKEKSKGCDHAVTGVIVVGPGRGEAFKVCIAKKQCKTHWMKELKGARKEASGSAAAREKREQAQQSKYELEQKRREEARAQYKQAMPNIIAALAAAVKKAPTKSTGLLGQLVANYCQARRVSGKQGDLVPRGSTADDLVRYAAFQVLLDDAIDDWNGHEHMPKTLKAFNLKYADFLPKAEKPATTTKAQTQKGKARKAA